MPKKITIVENFPAGNNFKGLLMRRCDAVAAHQRVDVWLAAPECHIEFHGVPCAAARKDALPQVPGSGWIKDSLLAKHLERIGIEHFGPFVTIVASSVSA